MGGWRTGNDHRKSQVLVGMRDGIMPDMFNLFMNEEG